MKPLHLIVGIALLLVGWSTSVVAAGDLVSGRVERTLRKDTMAVTSSIAYMYYVYRADMPKYQRVVNEFISNSVGTLWQDQPDRSTAELSSSWFAGVLSEFDAMYTEGQRVNPEPAPWTLIDTLFITDRVIVRGRPTRLVQVFKQQYQFTGGAHGLTSTLSMLFDRATGEMVFLKDLLGAHRKEFTAVVERFFRAQRRIPAKRSLKKAGYWFDNGFTVPDNVMFDGDDLVLIYNPYEIGPYVMGTIRVRMPLSKVLPMMQIPWL